MLAFRDSKMNRRRISLFGGSYSLVEKTDQKTDNYNNTKKENLVARVGGKCKSCFKKLQN